MATSEHRLSYSTDYGPECGTVRRCHPLLGQWIGGIDAMAIAGVPTAGCRSPRLSTMMTFPDSRLASGPNEELGRLLAQLRGDRGIAQKQLARLADIDNSTLSRLESGGRGVSRDVLDRICAALGLSGDEQLQVLVAADLLPPEAARVLADPELVRFSELLVSPSVDPADALRLRQFLDLALAFADARGYHQSSTPKRDSLP
jgi:transcriptional regulator with XRE-family HTH domain